MHILIDKTNWRMVAAAATHKWANLVAYCDFPSVDTCVVDSMDGATWTQIDRESMARLYTNMSGQPSPEYGVAIAQLRAYSESWPAYPKSESQLEREAEAIFQAEEAEKTGKDREFKSKQSAQIMRNAHQASIGAAEAAQAQITPEQRAQAQEHPPTKAKKLASEGVIVPRQGITKRIWEIADELLAVTGSIGNFKEFRTQVIARAAAEGANQGTAATQFGKWKQAKGL